MEIYLVTAQASNRAQSLYSRQFSHNRIFLRHTLCSQRHSYRYHGNQTGHKYKLYIADSYPSGMTETAKLTPTLNKSIQFCLVIFP